MYQSLANLIRWSDQVMLEGVNSEDKEMVTTVKGVIKAVLDGVKVWAQAPGRPRQGPLRGPLLGVGHTRTDAFLNLARQNERRRRPRGWPTLCPMAVSLPPEPSPRAGVNAQRVSAVARGPGMLPAGQGTAETVSALVLSEAHSTSPATSAHS